MSKDIKDLIEKIIKEEISQATTQSAMNIPPKIQNPIYPKGWEPRESDNQGWPDKDKRKLISIEQKTKTLENRMNLIENMIRRIMQQINFKHFEK